MEVRPLDLVKGEGGREGEKEGGRKGGREGGRGREGEREGRGEWERGREGGREGGKSTSLFSSQVAPAYSILKLHPPLNLGLAYLVNSCSPL